MTILLYALASLSASATLPGQPSCVLTAADKAASAALSFDDFDQKGTLPSTFRALSERGCAREAAEAAEDYLINGQRAPTISSESLFGTWLKVSP